MKSRHQAARPSDKQTRELFRQAAERGWTVTGGGMRHYSMRCPNPCRCAHVVSASTSNRWAWVKMQTKLNNHTCWNGAQKP